MRLSWAGPRIIGKCYLTGFVENGRKVGGLVIPRSGSSGTHAYTATVT